MKKTKALLLFALVLPTLTGCQNNEDKYVTVIDIEHYDGGVSHIWLDNAIERFTALKANESYEEGKTGVKFKVVNNKHANVENMSLGTTEIYITEDNGFPQELAALGTAKDITDWITGENGKAPGENRTIADKIDDSFKPILRYGTDQGYYGLPHYEIYPGVTYDYDLFNAKGLYFALDTEDENMCYSFTSNITNRDYRFIDDVTTQKSLGSDGLPNTDDDGLPSSIEEFIVLCEYMSTQFGIKPMLFPGNHQDYSSYFLEGLLASLSGKSGIESYYNFDGTINYIDYFENDDDYLFPNSGLATPHVVQTTLTEETGYKTRMTEERYACACLLELMEKNNFMDKQITSSTFNTNQVVQSLFLEGKRHGQYDFGMLCEGNYWVNEAKNQSTVYATFNRKNPGVVRDVRWMPLPTHIKTSITTENAEVEGKASTLMDTGNSFYLVNKIMQTPGLERAVKEFTQFLYSDAELQAFTKSTGLCISGLNYEFLNEDIESGLEPFQKAVLNIKQKSRCAWACSNSNIFKSQRNNLYFSINSPIWKPENSGGECTSFINAIRQFNYSAKDCMEKTKISEHEWNEYYLPFK